MLDVNGIELKAGDVVKVSGAYFKHDNGLYFIDHAPGDPSWSGSDCGMKGLNRNGAMSKTRTCAFWPLCAYTNDHDKNIRAREHNSAHAKIEIVRGVPVAGMIEHFKEQKESAEYWEKTHDGEPYDEKENPYKLINKTDVYHNEKDAKDNFSVIGGDFKYTIDTAVFSEAK